MWLNVALSLAVVAATPCEPDHSISMAGDSYQCVQDWSLHWDESASPEFAAFLRDRDLVGIGLVTSVDTLMVDWRMVRRAHVRIERILAGASATDTVTIGSSITRVDGLSGRRALFWVSRACGFTVGENCGNVAIAVDDDSPIGFACLNDEPSTRRKTGTAMTVASVERALRHTRTIGHPEVWEGAQALVHVRLRVLPRTPCDHLYACDSVSVVVGTVARAPRFVRFPRLEDDCLGNSEAIESGILLPLADARSSDTLTVASCQGPLVIDRGVVLGLGMTLEQVRTALVETPAGLRFREGALLRANR